MANNKIVHLCHLCILNTCCKIHKLDNQQNIFDIHYHLNNNLLNILIINSQIYQYLFEMLYNQIQASPHIRGIVENTKLFFIITFIVIK